VDHANNCEQTVKGSRCTKGLICLNYPDDFCQEHNWHKNHLSKKQEEYQSQYFDYIVVAMTHSLDDQTSHAKVFSSHHYEQQKLMEKMMTQSCQIFTTC